MRFFQLGVTCLAIYSTACGAIGTGEKPTYKTQSTFTAPPNSPIAKGEHPRLFLTRADIPKLHDKIQRYYAPDFARFVNFMDGLMHMAPGADELEDWNQLFGAIRSFSLLHLIDSKTLSGTQGSFSSRDYGRKAIDLALYVTAKLPADWQEPHSASDNLTGSKNGLASMALQIAYDWNYDIATLQERKTLAARLIAMWDVRYDSDKVKLENHYASNVHVYGAALSFWGDKDLGAAHNAKAQIMMDSFVDVFINRQLGVAEIIFEGSSDWVEGDAYAFDGFTGIMLMAATAGSALNKNYFSENPWLYDAPLYFYNNLMPMPLQGQYYFSQQNTSTIRKAKKREVSAVMNIAATMLKDSHPDIAAFASWYANRSPFAIRPVDKYRHYRPHLFDFFYKFLFGTRDITPKSPQESGVPLSKHQGNMHVMRSAHSGSDATLIQFFSPMYWYRNGHNEPEQGGFTIHRFGPLAVSASNTKSAGRKYPKVKKRGKGFFVNNVLGLGPDARLEVQMPKQKPKGDIPGAFQPNGTAHIGTVEAREHKPGKYDYINYNYTRSYTRGNKASLARRAMIYLRGAVNKEFVIIMDRLKSSEEKYFLLHTPGNFSAVGGNWQPVKQGHWKTSARAIKLVNRIDQAHGQLYLTSVYPKDAVLHKFGGPGFEWTNAQGTPLYYDASRFSERAAYLLGDHKLQIQSRQNKFLTVMQIGDANSMGQKAAVQPMEGQTYFGSLIDGRRLVLFSKQEKKLSSLSYTLTAGRPVEHLITEVLPNKNFTVMKGNRAIEKGTTGKDGTVFFEDHPGGKATYTIKLQ